MAPFDAAVAAAYIHGLAGDLLPEGRGSIAGEVPVSYTHLTPGFNKGAGFYLPGGTGLPD